MSLKILVKLNQFQMIWRTNPINFKRYIICKDVKFRFNEFSSKGSEGKFDYSYMKKAKGLLGRLQKTFLNTSKVIIPVHLSTSLLWMILFYCSSDKCLELLGETELLRKWAEDYSRMGNVAISLLLFKLSTPFRYLTTIYVAKFVVKYLKERKLLHIKKK